MLVGPRLETTFWRAGCKASLKVVWLRDESLENSASMSQPHILAQEIADDLRASLEQIEDELADLQARVNGAREDPA